MADRLRVACVQINSSADKATNLERVGAPRRARRRRRGRLVLLPEKWNGLGSHEILRERAEPLEGGETSRRWRGWARTHGITLVGGSIAERRDGRDKLSNTCAVLDPDGEIAVVYRKIHMFDVEVGGVSLPRVGTRGAGRRGRSCARARRARARADRLLRPALPRALPDPRRSGAPSSSPSRPRSRSTTGRDHWEILLRARAIENQCFVVAANQRGIAPGTPTYGRSR